MRARWLAMSVVASAVLVIAACSDASSPTGLSDQSSLAPGDAVAHFTGSSPSNDHGRNDVKGKKDEKGKKGHSDHESGECHDDDHGSKHDDYAHHLSLNFRHDDHDRGHDEHRHDKHKGKKHHGDDDDRDECGGNGGGGGPTTGTVSGTVMNNGAAVNAFPVFLLSANGASVVSNAATDATGAYSFAAVAPGSYLVCEADPFTPAWGMLTETRPNTGPACPSGQGYAPLGFSVTVAAGATVTGNDFTNFGVE